MNYSASKVEMSLQEYDQLKSDLAMYEEIVNTITSPNIHSWDLDYWKGHPGYSLSVYSDAIMSNLSKKSKNMLESLIKANVDSYMKSNNIEGTCDIKSEDIKMDLCTIKPIEKVDEE